MYGEETIIKSSADLFTKVDDGEIIVGTLFLNNTSFQITIRREIVELYDLKKGDKLRLQVIGFMKVKQKPKRKKKKK